MNTNKFETLLKKHGFESEVEQDGLETIYTFEGHNFNVTVTALENGKVEASTTNMDLVSRLTDEGKTDMTKAEGNFRTFSFKGRVEDSVYKEIMSYVREWMKYDPMDMYGFTISDKALPIMKTLSDEFGEPFSHEIKTVDYVVRGDKYDVYLKLDRETGVATVETVNRSMLGKGHLEKAVGNRRTIKTLKAMISYIEKYVKYGGHPPKKVSATSPITEPVIIQCPAFADEEGYLLDLPSFEEKRKELKEICEEVGAHKHGDIKSQAFWMLAKRGRLLTSTQWILDMVRTVLEARGYEVSVEIANPFRTGRKVR